MTIGQAINENIEPLRFLSGVKAFFAGVKWVFLHPKYLLLGIIPAIISSALLFTGFIVLVASSGWIVNFISPLTSDLWPWLATGIRIAFQSAIIAAAGVLAYVLFAAVALAIGDPIYSKIAETYENEQGHEIKTAPWSSGVKDALILVLKGLGIAILAFIVGFIPFLGGFLSFIVTWTFIPFFLAEELLGRTLVPKGIFGHNKSKLLMKDKRATWSFGVLCQLLFTIPIVQVLVMPSAVAGAAILAKELIEKENNEIIERTSENE